MTREQATNNQPPLHVEISRRGMSDLFGRIATVYDLYNDILSFGVHRLTRRTFLRKLNPHSGQLILDVCAGTGALTWRATRRGAQVVSIDGCEPMLRRLMKGTPTAPAVLGDVLTLPFADNSFDAAMIGFAVRDIASPLRMFREIARVLKPGGVVGNLDFTQPVGRLKKAYQFYLRTVVPRLGGIFDRSAYWFLAESVDRVIGAPELAEVIREAGFAEVEITYCAMGVAAVHIGRMAGEGAL